MIKFSQRITCSIIVSLFILFAGCRSDHPATQTASELPAASVSLFTVRQSAPVRQVEIMGTVQAADSAELAARISGTIQELTVNPGSRVKKDDLLVVISAGEMSAKVLQAQAQREQVARNLAREQALLQKNATTPATVKTLEESMQIAEAAYREARTMLSYTEIKAPFDGVITRKMTNVGDLATPGKPLLRLDDESQLQIIAAIPETLVLGISLGDILPVYIPAAELSLSGEVTEIAPLADPLSRTAPVKLTVNADKKLRSGQFARVSLPGSRGTALMIPDTAVQSYGQMEKVFVVMESKARMQLVRTGLHFGDQVEIVSGINDGDQIVVAGNKDLQDGQPVKVQ